MAKRRTPSPDEIDPRNNLQWYTRQALKNADVWTDQAVRKEYRRLRDIAQKRLKTLAKYEPDSYAFTRNVGRYPGAKGATTAELRALMPDLAKFIAASMGSVMGIRRQRRKAVNTLREHGYTGVTMKNIKEFGRFMQEWRDKKLTNSYGSPEVVEAFEFTQAQTIPWNKINDDFEQWLAEQEQLRSYVRIVNENGEKTSADRVLEAFEKIKAGMAVREIYDGETTKNKKRAKRK